MPAVPGPSGSLAVRIGRGRPEARSSGWKLRIRGSAVPVQSRSSAADTPHLFVEKHHHGFAQNVAIHADDEFEAARVRELER